MNYPYDSLLEVVRESHRNGMARRYTRGRNLEQVYDTLQVLAMAERLSEKEIITLGMATDLRERGLKAARNGEIDEGMSLIAEARKIYESADLTTEAVDCAETFQTAAESYVEYKLSDYETSLLSMTNSLLLCESLANSYGYPFEMRRVHLARNIARIHSYTGDTNEALRIAANLLLYTGGNEKAWPLPYPGPTRRHLLEEDAALFMLDQVLSEVLRLLEPDESATVQNLPVVAQARDLLMSCSPAFQRAAHCLSACIGYVEDDTHVFLDASRVFFETGPQSLEFAWREVESKLLRTFRDFSWQDDLPGIEAALTR